MTFDELRASATVGRGGYLVFGGPFAQMSVTLEDAGFLYALVRLTKPKHVLELGTGEGISARFIGEALAANGDGTLTTVEPMHSLWPDAGRLLAGLPVGIVATAPTETVLVCAVVQPDLVFIDSGYQTRERDIHDWLNGAYQGLVCVHDANRDYPELHNHPGVLIPGVDGLWLGRAR